MHLWHDCKQLWQLSRKCSSTYFLGPEHIEENPASKISTHKHVHIEIAPTSVRFFLKLSSVRIGSQFRNLKPSGPISAHYRYE